MRLEVGEVGGTESRGDKIFHQALKTLEWLQGVRGETLIPSPPWAPSSGVLIFQSFSLSLCDVKKWGDFSPWDSDRRARQSKEKKEGGRGFIPF